VTTSYPLQTSTSLRVQKYTSNSQGGVLLKPSTQPAQELVRKDVGGISADRDSNIRARLSLRSSQDFPTSGLIVCSGSFTSSSVRKVASHYSASRMPLYLVEMRIVACLCNSQVYLRALHTLALELERVDAQLTELKIQTETI
jgi:hypothetical protein